MEKTSHKTILIVDDDDNLREDIADALKLSEYQVLTSRSGNEAAALLVSHHVDIVISDIRMPDGSGLNLFDEIHKRKNAKPQFIFMTGYTDEPLGDRLEEGVRKVLKKPFSLKDLLSAVKLR